MAHRYTDKLEGNFTTKLSDFQSAPGNLPGIPQALEVHRVEVGNNSGGDARLGWGYVMAQSTIKVGDYDVPGASPKYTDRSADLALGATLLGTGGGILIQSPEPFHSIQFNVTVVGGAISQQSYFDGTSLKVFDSAGTEHTEYDTLDLTGLGAAAGIFVKPADMAPLAATDSLVTDEGLTAGMYVWLIELATPVTVDNLDIVRLQNRVEVVANGNSLVDSYDGGKKLPGGARIVGYCSTANKANSLIVEYRQAP